MGRTIPTRRGGLHRWLQSLILTTLGHARYPRPLDRCRTVRAGGGSGLVRGRGGLPATAGAGARGMGSCGTAGRRRAVVAWRLAALHRRRTLRLRPGVAACIGGAVATASGDAGRRSEENTSEL